MLYNKLTSLSTETVKTHLIRVEASISKLVDEGRPEDGPWLSNLRLQRSQLVNELTLRQRQAKLKQAA